MNKTDLLKELIAAEKADPTLKITTPGDIFPMLAKYASAKVESMYVVSLDGAHKVIKVRKVSMGLLNRTLVHPRETFVGAIKDRAAAIIMAHNHPSGNLDPSKEDIELCTRFKKAGSILGIELLDNLIITPKGYYSFLEEQRI